MRARIRPRSARGEASSGTTDVATQRAHGPRPMRSSSPVDEDRASLVDERHAAASTELSESDDGGADRVEVELAEPVVGAAGDDLLGQLALRVEQLVDPLLERRRADEAVDEDVLVLAEPVGAVGRLLLDGGVPPAVEVEDVVRGGQVEAAPAGANRDHEHRRPVGVGERLDELVALSRGEAAVEEADLAAEPLVQVRHEPVEARGTA